MSSTMSADSNFNESQEISSCLATGAGVIKVAKTVQSVYGRCHAQLKDSIGLAAKSPW